MTMPNLGPRSRAAMTWPFSSLQCCFSQLPKVKLLTAERHQSSSSMGQIRSAGCILLILGFSELLTPAHMVRCLAQQQTPSRPWETCCASSIGNHRRVSTGISSLEIMSHPDLTAGKVMEADRGLIFCQMLSVVKQQLIIGLTNVCKGL